MESGPPADVPYAYFTTRGHKSGNPHHVEIWYVEYSGRVYIVAEHREKTHWVRNLRHDPTITFRVGLRDDGAPERSGRGRIVDPDAEPELTAAVRALMDAKYEWSDGTIAELTYAD